MKQLIQSYKTGEIDVYDVPVPFCDPNGLLVKTNVSLVSAGTEKMVVDLAKKSLLGKARSRPDLVKQVISKMKQEGIKNTLEKVFTKLDTPFPLGYSCAGEIIEVGSNISGFSIGDRVACGGAGFASHSEVNYVPKNLTVKIPDNVDDTDASFVTVGSIALQGVRQADPAIGEKIVVIGLGLIGLLTVQILKANGCKVLGVDIDLQKITLAKELGADEICTPNDLLQKAEEFTDGYGCDTVIITASTPSNQPIEDAGEICRLKGKVIVVGLVGMNIPRTSFYKKELELKLSMAYGAGRYDPLYEEMGIDYPYSYVRWTEQRNFEAFLGLISAGKVTPKKLITHYIDFQNAIKAYDILEGKVSEKYLGIVFNYNNEVLIKKRNIVQLHDKFFSSEKINVGLIGAGNFTKGVILPALKMNKDFNLVGLCTFTGVSAHSTGTKYNFKYITTNSDEILKNEEINTVIVTTKHNDHAAKVIASLTRKKHVFVEKPLCITSAELEEIKNVYQEQDQKSILQVGFNRRFSPLLIRMKGIINNQPLSVNYRINAGIIPKDSWIQNPEVGGGRIIGEVCHFIDTCSFLIGDDPVTVYASCIRKNDQSVPDEDNVSILLNYANGSNATITYFAYGNKQMPKEYIEVFAPNIAMQMEDFRKLITFKGSKKTVIKKANQDKGFTNEFLEFQKSIKSGIPAIDFISLYKTTKCTFKIIESLKTNQVLDI